MSVGSRIKELRKKRGMTQFELADGVVTRGMLSRIENGTASPSMQSLQGLAEKLSVSPAFLLDEQSEILTEERERITRQTNAFFKNGQYASAYYALKEAEIEITPSLSGVYVYSAFHAGYERFCTGDFRAADSMLCDAEACLPLLIPSVNTVTEKRISFLRKVMANVSDPDAIIHCADDVPDFGFEPSLFLCLAKRVKHETIESILPIVEFCNLSQPYRTYFKAQQLIASYNFVDAILAMKALCAAPDIPLFLSLLCTAAVERCCKLCEDYKGAYENQLRYQSLLRSIQK